MAPKSFIARRGQVKDNGTNFTLAEKKLRFMITACNQKKIHDLFLRNDIKRNFNSPTPLNHGGLKEKFIRDKIRSLVSKQVLWNLSWDLSDIILKALRALFYPNCQPICLDSKYWLRWWNFTRLFWEWPLQLREHDNFENITLFTTLDYSEIISGKVIYLNKIPRMGFLRQFLWMSMQ